MSGEREFINFVTSIQACISEPKIIRLFTVVIYRFM